MSTSADAAVMRLRAVRPVTNELAEASANVGDPNRQIRAGAPVTSLILRLERLPKQVVDLGAVRNGTEATTLGRWSATAALSQDGCLVLDPQGRIVSLSELAAELFDCSDGGVIGRRLLDVITVIDLETGEAGPDYQTRIPPLAAIEGRMVRSMIRLRHGDDATLSLDIASMPLHDAHRRVVGTMSFIETI